MRAKSERAKQLVLAKAKRVFEREQAVHRERAAKTMLQEPAHRARPAQAAKPRRIRELPD